MGSQYGTWFEHGVSPLPLFLFTGALIYGIWRNFDRTGTHRDSSAPHATGYSAASFGEVEKS
jgi:hypothetical protein